MKFFFLAIFFLNQTSIAEELKTNAPESRDQEIVQKKEKDEKINVNEPKADIKTSEVIKVDQGKAFPRDI